MQTQFRPRPIFVPIINHLWTPNNNSILIVKKWFEELYGPSSAKLLDTWPMSKSDFFRELKLAVGMSDTICMYICLHGKQYKNAKTGEPEEFLKVNENTLIPDTEFSELINSLKYKNLYIFLEVCHGGGLVNTIKIDDTIRDMSNVNIVIFNVCSKEQKCYVNYDRVNTIGMASRSLMQYHINPFAAPDRGLLLLKKLYGYLHTKVTVIKNLS